MATIDALLNLVPDHPDAVLTHLQAHPDLASKQDRHGYSLLHAATSYNHLDLLKTLIQDYNVDPNILDEDGETCLFNAESVDFARELLDLGVRLDVKNIDGLIAAERLDDEDEQPDVAAFLRQAASSNGTAGTDAAAMNGNAQSSALNGTSIAADDTLHPPPPLPEGVQINIGTMQPGDEGEEPDPEFRRRIEELASRPDFESEETQRELRNLVSDAVSGLASDSQGPAASRRRVD